MATILNSAMLNFAFLYSAFLVFPLKLTHTCHDWLPPFAQKKLHSFILIKLDDGSHLEFCHVGFRHCHLGFRHLVIFSQIDSKHSHSTLNLTQSNSVWLIWWWQPSWILPPWIQPFCIKNFTHSFWLNLMMAAILNSIIFYSAILHKKNFTHSFWLNVMMAAILNSAMLDSHCHLGFRHLVIFSQIDSKHSHSTLNLTQSNSVWLICYDGFMNSAILDSAILHKTLTQTNSIWLKLIHSHSTWWCQASWILPSWIQPFWTKKTSLIHSHSTW